MSGPVSARDAAAGIPVADGRVTIEAVTTKAQVTRFIRSAWPIYAGDPKWVPPLISDVRNALNPKKHPFHAHADVALFMARTGNQVAGRIAAIVNRSHNDFHNDSLGFFGLFESVENQAVADALLHAAESWLKRKGMTAVRGPMNLSTNDELWSPGVLVEGFDTPPAVMMGHTPPYYARLLEDAGYTGAKDLLAYWIDTRRQDRLERTADRLARRSGFTIRSLDMRHLDEEVAIIQRIYNSAWSSNWGFVPMTGDEIQHLATQLKPVVNPQLCGMAFVGDDPVGFALALPDYNQVLPYMNGRLLPFGIFRMLWHRRHIDAARTLTLGVTPEYRGKGLDALLILHLFRQASRVGMPRGECSWILEDNLPMRNALERMDASVYKRYRVYDKPLS